MVIILFAVLAIGCSGSGSAGNPVAPVIPELPDPTDLTSSANNLATSDSGHVLWGFWQVAFNTETGEVELVNLRDAMFHVNVVGNLQAPFPPGLSITINEFIKEQGYIDLDLKISHPFKNSNLRGFDVRGIVMGSGETYHGKADTTLTFTKPNGFRILNADGYTRWWNAQEFTSGGLYGFVPGNLGPKTYVPLTNLNGYKYFADVLGPNDPVVPNVNPANRGTFSTDTTPPELVRNYKLSFPIGGSGDPVWLFQYAVDASWAPPTGPSPKPKPIEDYPITANCPEAFNIEVDTTGTDAWFVDNSNLGGNLVLSLEVFDWGATDNPGGINGEVASILIESPTLFDSPVFVPLNSQPGSQSTSGIFTVVVPNVHPTGNEDQEVLITVNSADPTTYAPPISGPSYPAGAPLAAYKLFEVPISDQPPIPAVLTVMSPNGGEILEAGMGWDVTWTSEGPVGDFVKIEYSESDEYFTQITASTENYGTFMWNPIPNVDDIDFRIVVTSTDSPAVFDQSDEYFTISHPKITITEPNGGEIWTPGDAETITWENFGNTGFEVRIDYTISDGDPVNIVMFEENDGSYLWAPIPDMDSTEVKIVVTSIDFPSISDASDNYFTISTTPPPTIIVTQPNGGEVWTVGSSGEITWESYGLVGFVVRIDYSINDGPPVNIVSITGNDLSYTWDPIADVNSDSVKVIVSSVINPAVYDDSDNYFTIHPEKWLEITSPNGGETLTGVGTWDITWDWGGTIDNVDIWYSAAEGDGFPYPVQMFAPNTGTYVWDPVDNIDTSEGKLWIYESTDPTVEDFSDGYFTINSVPQDLTLTVPNGGEEWLVGGSGTIEWTTMNLWGDIDISYTVADGDDPVVIADDVPNTGTFEWNNIPLPATTTARVRVQSDYYPALTDASDNYFTISDTDTLTLTSPNGGENLEALGTWQVTWGSTGTIATVNLRLSTEFVTVYDTDIALGIGNTGSYIWNPVPDLDIDTCLVMVQDADNLSLNDVSDAYFSIHPAGPETGWVPIAGLTQKVIGPPIPNQEPEPADIAIFSNGAADDQSRGFVSTETATPETVFSLYNDQYESPVLLDWTFPHWAAPIHKFDVSTDGAFVFVVNSNADKFPNTQVNDPAYCAFAACDATDGTFSDGFWHLYGDTGTPDPDDVPWRRVVDVSSGLSGGVDDTTFFYLTVIADHPDQPQPHDGNILLSLWLEPYDQDGFTNWLVNTSTQGGGTGFVDDTAPAKMAFAVDDDSGLAINSNTAPSFWVLGSDGRITSHILAPATGDLAVIDNQLDSEEYGTAMPVDIECAPAKEFDYSVSDPNPFNWLCVLLDNGDGTWSVGIWECDFLADPVVYHLIDVTTPITGTPMSLDIDGTDFEIHVLSDNGGTVELTVFEYIPE